MYFVIRGCYLHDFTVGIQFSNVKNATIKDSKICGEGRRGSGIHLESVKNIEITNVEISETVCGIEVYSSEHILISGNTIKNIGDLNYARAPAAIRLEKSESGPESSSIEVCENTIKNSIIGISISQSKSNKILRNVIRNSHYGEGGGAPWMSTSLICRRSSYNQICDNMITNVSSGMMLSQSFNNTISGNKISECCQIEGPLATEGKHYGSGSEAFYLEESGYNYILNNNVEQSNGIVLMYSYNNVVSGNSLKDVTWGIQIRIGDGDVSKRPPSNFNTISNNTYYLDKYAPPGYINTAFILRGASKNIFTGNMVHGDENTPLFLGISFQESHVTGVGQIYPSQNVFYNNDFAATENIDLTEKSKRDLAKMNVWNLSPYLGTNIIGGNMIGGNYWGDYKGKDTNGDGIGDTNLPYGPGDYAPLVKPGEGTTAFLTSGFEPFVIFAVFGFTVFIRRRRKRN